MHGKQLASLLLAVAVGVLVGFVLGRTTASDAPTATSPDPEIHRPPTPAEPAPPPVELAGRTATEASNTEAGDRPPNPSRLRLVEGDGSTIDAEVARRTAALIAQAEAAAATAEATARRQVETEIARERAFLEDAERGGTMALLRTLRTEKILPNELVSDAERFGALFERKTRGGTVDARTVTKETELGDGDVLRYGPGRHAVLVGSWLNRMEPFPKDLLVEGYGMDQTVLVLDDDLSMRSEVHSLTFRDLTIHCNDNYLDRMRTAPYTLRLERCRVIGFDMGAGSSSMLSGRVGAFYATECRIEAGYGRSPGHGNLFDVRGMLVARLEDCVIGGPFGSIYRNGAVRFVRCRFEDMAPRSRSNIEREEKGRVFEDCTFDYLTQEEYQESRKKRPLTDLNPAWK